MSDKPKGIESLCEIIGIKNMAAGQFRLTLDLPASMADRAAWLIQEAAKTGIVYKLFVLPAEGAIHENSQNDRLEA